VIAQATRKAMRRPLRIALIILFFPPTLAAVGGWLVPSAFHTAALGYEPAEFRRRVLDFFARYAGT